MAEPLLTYPGLCFDNDGDFRIVVGAEALSRFPRHELKRGAWLGGLVIDAQTRAFRIQEIEQLEDPSEGVWSKLFGLGRSLDAPARCRLVEAPAITLEAVKQKVCFAIERYADLKADEAADADESRDLKPQLLSAVQSATSVPDIIAKIDAWADAPTTA
jgi:hypothetical protein